MKNLVNRVQLIGNLGSDPELLTMSTGTSMAKFRLATNEYFQNKKGEKVTETTWHNIVAWGPQGERIAAMFQKGMQVAITGKLRNRSYETKDGAKKYTSEVILNDYYKLSKSASEKGTISSTSKEDTLPF
jgi:single-strand DNA-binding protein